MHARRAPVSPSQGQLFSLSVAEGQVVRACFFLLRKPYLFDTRQYPRVFWFRIELAPCAPRRLRSPDYSRVKTRSGIIIQ